MPDCSYCTSSNQASTSLLLGILCCLRIFVILLLGKSVPVHIPFPESGNNELNVLWVHWQTHLKIFFMNFLTAPVIQAVWTSPQQAYRNRETITNIHHTLPTGDVNLREWTCFFPGNSAISQTVLSHFVPSHHIVSQWLLTFPPQCRPSLSESGQTIHTLSCQ